MILWVLFRIWTWLELNQFSIVCHERNGAENGRTMWHRHHRIVWNMLAVWCATFIKYVDGHCLRLCVRAQAVHCIWVRHIRVCIYDALIIFILHCYSRRSCSVPVIFSFQFFIYTAWLAWRAHWCINKYTKNCLNSSSHENTHYIICRRKK